VKLPEDDQLEEILYGGGDSSNGRGGGATARPSRRRRGRHSRNGTPVFANFVEQPASAGNGDGAPVRVGKSLVHLGAELGTLTGGWPRRVDGLLFVPGLDHRPTWLGNADALFAWIGRSVAGPGGNPVEWASGPDKVTHGQFYAHLQQTAEAYDAVENYPHEPALPRHFYLHPQVKGGNGRALRGLLDRLSPATGADRDLMLAFFLTLFWGGTPGQRPAWLVTTDDGDDPLKGRGSGKSTLAKVGGYLCGGLVQATARDEMPKVITRLLSPSARTKRVMLIDNIKSLKFSWADLEALITSDVISGHQLYAGEGQRPNTLIWCLTINGASLSRDMAQRTVIIQVKRPDYSPTWEDEVRAYIDARRWEVIGDCLAMLRQEPKELGRYNRWGAWEAGVLSRVGDPSECQKVIAERQEAVDDDANEAATVRDAFRAELQRRGHDPDAEALWIPSAVAAEVVCAATNERYAINKASAYLGTLSIPELRKSDLGGGRGWAWRGRQSPTGQALGRLDDAAPPPPGRRR
jgi:hypothetical protein